MFPKRLFHELLLLQRQKMHRRMQKGKKEEIEEEKEVIRALRQLWGKVNA